MARNRTGSDNAYKNQLAGLDDVDVSTAREGSFIKNNGGTFEDDLTITVSEDDPSGGRNGDLWLTVPTGSIPESDCPFYAFFNKADGFPLQGYETGSGHVLELSGGGTVNFPIFVVTDNKAHYSITNVDSYSVFRNRNVPIPFRFTMEFSALHQANSADFINVATSGDWNQSYTSLYIGMQSNNEFGYFALTQAANGTESVPTVQGNILPGYEGIWMQSCRLIVDVTPNHMTATAVYIPEDLVVASATLNLSAPNMNFYPLGEDIMLQWESYKSLPYREVYITSIEICPGEDTNE